MTDRTGITRTPTGWRVYVRVRPYEAARHFPPGTPLRDLVQARDALRVALRERRNREARLAPTAGSFHEDALRYLAAVRAMPTYTTREWIVHLWVERFGSWRRHDITSADIRAALADWHDRYAPRTLGHLRSVLMHLWHVLDGKSAVNPVRDVPAPRLPDDLPRNIPVQAVAAILRRIAPSRTRSVLWLMATTGLTPTEIRRLRPQDVGLDTLVALGRRKGKGSRPRTLPLTRHARAAVRSFGRMAAWGGVRLGTLQRAWHRARRLAGYGAEDWRVYDLRHTFLTEMARAGDDRVVQYLAGHTSTKMTQRYTLGSVPGRVRAVVASVVASPVGRPRKR